MIFRFTFLLSLSLSFISACFVYILLSEQSTRLYFRHVVAISFGCWCVLRRQSRRLLHIFPVAAECSGECLGSRWWFAVLSFAFHVYILQYVLYLDAQARHDVFLEKV